MKRNVTLEEISDGNLYEANDRVYFGEMTLYPDSGFDTDILPSTDMNFGKRLIL